jgi:hypothetical protein
MRVLQCLQRWLARLFGRRHIAPASGRDLIALAKEVEQEDPALAAELRGIAMHRDATPWSSS